MQIVRAHPLPLKSMVLSTSIVEMTFTRINGPAVRDKMITDDVKSEVIRVIHRCIFKPVSARYNTMLVIDNTMPSIASCVKALCHSVFRSIVSSVNHYALLLRTV